MYVMVYVQKGVKKQLIFNQSQNFTEAKKLFQLAVKNYLEIKSLKKVK